MNAKEYMEQRKRTFLDYSQITNVDLARLRDFLKEEIAASLERGETTTSSLKLRDKVKVEYNRDLTLRAAYFLVDSHYFEKREAISFNADGFIGLCGWADSKNARPFYNAFERWLETVIFRLSVRRVYEGADTDGE